MTKKQHERVAWTGAPLRVDNVRVPAVGTIDRRTPANITRTAAAFGFLVVATQRVGITLGTSGSLSAPTVISCALLVWMLIRCRVRVDPAAVAIFAALAIMGAVSALAASDPSFPSLLYFLATYSLLLVSGAQAETQIGRPFLKGSLAAIVLGAVASIAQWLFQLAGNGYIDLVGDLPKWLLRGGFNTYYDLQYAGGAAGQYKPNGMIFLEPSFLALYTAIALVLTLAQLPSRHSSRRATAALILSIIILLGGFAASASASGVVVLAAAAVPLFARSRRRLRWALTAILTIAILWRMRLIAGVVAKLHESVFSTTTSAGLRLWLPYKLLGPYWLESPIIGSGPGAAARAIDEINIRGLQATTVMKVLLEYGVIGAAVLAVAVIWALSRTQAPAALISALLAAWIVPTEGLLNSTLVTLLFVGLAHWTTLLPPAERTTRRLRTRRRLLLASPRSPSPSGGALQSVRARY